jgi:hypothetical protein
MGAHPAFGPMKDRSYVEIDALEAAEGALDLRQAFIGGNGAGNIEALGVQAGAQDINAVKVGLGVGL